MKLPQEFEDKMSNLLGDEYIQYLNSYENPKYQGIRINIDKINLDDWKIINPFGDTPSVDWCQEGFYYYDKRPAKHPYYFAGLYYIQEPSAMSAGAYLPIDEGDCVLDLCAAPGGKSTQLGAKLKGSGVLVANDISASRAKALVKNLDNFGIRQAMVVSEEPEKLAKHWQGCFDKILIDAPCSGEGMFRKDDNAIKSWEKYGIQHFCELQRDILKSAAQMLKVNGMMLYSTCTFSPEENEQMIAEFLQNNPEFEIIALKPKGGIQSARFEWCNNPKLQGALRLWPHHLKGEGHFLCLLSKISGKNLSGDYLQPTKKIKDYKIVADFIKNNTHISLDEYVLEQNNKIYMVSKNMPTQNKIRVLRSGLLLGELKKNRFEVAHQLSIAYDKDMYKNIINFQSDDQNVIKYLKGETILYDDVLDKEYYVICVDGFPLGWAKTHNKMLKNQYPKSWRMMG